LTTEYNTPNGEVLAAEPVPHDDEKRAGTDTQRTQALELFGQPSEEQSSKWLYSTYELLGVLDPEWQVDGVFPRGSLVIIYGWPGHGKSFVAQDLAHRIGEGLSWFGHEVRRPGQVVYISAEGNTFTKLRAFAWLMEHTEDADIDAPNVFYFLDSVQFMGSADSKRLLSEIRWRKVSPELIVIDTLARCSVGGDENSAKDMGIFIDTLKKLQAEFRNTTIIVVHHTGKDKRQERGTTALRGAADVMIKVSKSADGVITITNDKQKDGREFNPVKLRLKELQVGSGTGDKPLTSCAVVLATGEGSGSGSTVPAAVPDGLTPKLRNLLAILKKQKDQTIGTGAWIKASKLRESDLRNQCAKLITAELIEKVKHGTYRLTKTGANLSKTAKVKPQQ
jgi:AAA domain